MAQEIVSLADPFLDFTASDFVFVLFPRTIKLGVPDLGMANWRVESAEGAVKNLFGGSEWFFDRKFELWSLWIHEYGHPMGLAGHSPRSNLSLMDNQNGKSLVAFVGTFARTRRRTAGSAEGRRGPHVCSLRRFTSPGTVEGRVTNFQNRRP